MVSDVGFGIVKDEEEGAREFVVDACTSHCVDNYTEVTMTMTLQMTCDKNN